MKYTKDLHNKIVNLFRSDTYTVKEICTQCQISRETFYNWNEKYKKLNKEIKDAKNVRSLELERSAENSLIKRVRGVTVREVTQYRNKKGIITGSEEKIKEIPPDFQSIKFALTNTNPEKWSDKKQVEADGDIILNYVFNENKSDKDNSKS